MRRALNELPAAHGGLHNPMLGIGVGTGIGGIHLPVEREFRMPGTNLVHSLSKLGFHRSRGRAWIAPHVDVDFGCRRRKGRLVGPTTTNRRNGALRWAESRGITFLIGG